VLDLGGQFLHLALTLHAFGHVVTAADVAPYGDDSRLRARSGPRLAVHHLRSLAELGFPDATFDVIFFLEVLEHLAQNRRQGGRGMGPAVDDVLTLHTGAHHWKEYGRRELRRYFSLLGWQIARTESFNYVPALQDCLYLELLPPQ